MSGYDYLPVGVRGHAVRAPETSARKKGKRKGAMRRPVPLPSYLLVLDTETTIDIAQQLNFGAYHYYRLEWGAEPPYDRALSGWENEPPYMILLEEGLIHADDLAKHYPAGMRALRRYARSRRSSVDREHRWAAFGGLRLLSRHDFARKVLRRAAEEARAVICAFNFPFDLSRLAIAYAACRTGSCAGGFSFSLAEHPDGQVNDYPPRWGVLHIDSKKAIKTLQPGRDGIRFTGNLLDLRTLVHALTAEGHTLESACKAFDVPYKKRKVKHGRITARYIDYCREDVDATARLWRAAMIAYRRHPIALPAERAYSSAAIGKAYLRALGITPPAERGLSDRVDGYAAVAYYGGRAECRIRRTPVPVQPFDFKSMYPTVCSLLDLWALLVAERIDVREQSPGALMRWLDRLTLDDCFDSALWNDMRAIALVEPNGHILPVRARYSDHGSTWGIGVNVFKSDEPLWYTLPELVGSKILATAEGRVWTMPKIRRVLRFEPRGQLESLGPVRLRGDVLVDPRKRDLFRACVEARQARKNELRRLVASGMMTPEQAKADPLAHFLKILVNATSYGIFAEIVRHERADEEIVTVNGLETFESETIAPEEAAEFYCAPIAALITGGARLMLAMLERCVTDLGGTYLATDTDSMAIVSSREGGLVPCPGGSHRTDDGREAALALSWQQVDGIADRLKPPNPYKRSLDPGSILELEDEATDPDTGERLDLWGYAISAKRYCYYTRDANGNIEIRKASEHGLGQYLDPTNPERREPIGKRTWIREVWKWTVRTDALGEETPEPEWLDRPALRQHPISTPRLLRPLEALHADLSYAEQVKPFGFMTIATPLDRRAIPSEPFALVQPYSSNPRDWAEKPWVNVHDGPGGPRYRIGYADEWGVHVFRERPTAPHQRKGETVIAVKRFRDVLRDFVRHPERKSATPDGTPCQYGTRGLLRRRMVALGTVTHLGKEANLLEEVLAGLHDTDADELQTEYHARSLPSLWALVLETLRGLPVSRIAEMTGLRRHTVAAVLRGARPYDSTRAALTQAAISHATAALTERRIKPPTRPESRLALFLHECGLAVCPVCGGRLPSGRATYCSRACKQSAYRARTAA